MFDNLLIFTLLADAYRYKWKTLEYCDKTLLLVY